MTKLKIKITDFLETGNFGPLRLGMAMQEVEYLFGNPEQTGIGDNYVAQFAYGNYLLQFNSSNGYYDPESSLLAIFAIGLFSGGMASDMDFENDQVSIEGNWDFTAIKTFGQAKAWCEGMGIAYEEEVHTFDWNYDFHWCDHDALYANLKLPNELALCYRDSFTVFVDERPITQKIGHLNDYLLVTAARLDMAAIKTLPYYFH